MCGEGCLGGGLEVVGRVFLYSSYTHPIFILYKSFESGSKYRGKQRAGCREGQSDEIYIFMNM